MKNKSNKIFKKTELIAPAGNWQMLNAAINAGANAVYFGVDRLNMRAKADNFKINEIAKVVKHCHACGVKTHLTLNSIVFDDEFKDVDRILKAAKKAGVDMIIAWDMSVVQIARKLKLPICLSTQASVSNAESARFFKELGIRRIVPARECNLEQIKQIKKIGIEVETFIHGAMCVSISGRCFLSHFVNGRSANRGKCIQPCRREYKIVDTQDGNELVIGKNYVLSPKDLCMIENIDKLIEAGIDAFKIEGRKRSPEYVSIVVSVYKEAIDLYFKGKLTQEKKHELKQRMLRVFNKGFSEGFYFRKPGINEVAQGANNLASERKEYVGIVLGQNKDGIATIRIDSGKLSKGDNIYLQGKETGCVESVLNDLVVDGSIVKSAKKGDVIRAEIIHKVNKKDAVYLIVKNI